MSKMRVKDIKRDEVEVAVADATGRLRDMASSHRRTLIVVLSAVAILALGIVGARWWMKRQALAAQAEYAAAAKMAADLDVPPEPTPGQAPSTATWADVAKAFEKVAAEHGGTSAGRVAAFRVGPAQLRAGDATAAASTLAAFVEKHPDDWATPHALVALSAAREQAGDVTGAEAALETLRAKEWPSYPAASAVQRMAELYERTDRDDEAKKLWTLLAEDARFEKTYAQEEAKKRVEGLTGKPGP